ncbi:MAG: hypothetical protein IT210_17180 [Armatimonadetes bacterium]|nr:hypothetical protein [Armatimonadota bacterium]
MRTHVLLLILATAIFSVSDLTAQAQNKPSTKNRVVLRTTERDRLFHQALTLQFKETPLLEALSVLSKATRIPFEIGKNFIKPSSKITLICYQAAPAKILTAIAENFDGEWVRRGKAFYLVPLGEGSDPIVDVLAQVEMGVSGISPDSRQSNLTSEQKRIVEGIQSRLDSLRAANPPWLPDTFANSVLKRSEQGNRTTWSLSSTYGTLAGELFEGGVAAKSWFFSNSN